MTHTSLRQQTYDADQINLSHTQTHDTHKLMTHTKFMTHTHTNLSHKLVKHKTSKTHKLMNQTPTTCTMNIEVTPTMARVVTGARALTAKARAVAQDAIRAIVSM